MKLIITLFCIAMLGGLTGCGVPGKVTGGGWIPSSGDDSKKANFGFNGNSCDGLANGHFNFHDKYADGFKGGVKMNGEVMEAYECVGDILIDNPGCYVGTFPDALDFTCYALGFPYYEIRVEYRSTNPRHRGEGMAIACIRDNGEGANATSSDEAYISVLSGPYVDYKNSGPVQGNIQSHPCDTVPEQTASLGDRVWNDLNADGIQDDGEPGIKDVTVELWECDNQGYPATDTSRTETTDDEGFYVFENLTEGSYAVQFPEDEMTKAGWTVSLQNQGNDDAIDSDADPTTGLTHCVDLVEADENLDLDAGFFNSACSDMAPITSLTMVWVGSDNVTMTTDVGQEIEGVNSGDVVVFATPRDETGNDMEVFLTAGVVGTSVFHLSCSDTTMDGPEDCGTQQGNGKGDDSSLINDFLFEGMTGENGSLHCTP